MKLIAMMCFLTFMVFGFGAVTYAIVRLCEWLCEGEKKNDID